jgi:hypothetical protein
MNQLVYLHKNRCTNEVFYVGVGNMSRAYDENSRSKEWKENISECYFNVEIIAKNLSKEIAFRIERSLIEMYGLKNLVNKTKGGSGALGYKHTSETKIKIAKGQLGRKRSKEEIQKSVDKKNELYSHTYKHIKTGQIFKGLKKACVYFDISYNLEIQRIKRNSYNKNFELIK